MISAAQIEQDLAQLAQLTDCVRVYSTDYGLDQIAGIAARHGLKVLQGLWLSSSPAKNKEQIESAVALANRYPGTIRAVVVGNEVLLRGEMAANDLADTIRAVKARVKVPVTYADVWEFWLRNRDVAAAVDFVTIHILPYWEDFPIAADKAAAHVDAIRQRVVAAFPGKEMLIGEVGWPSAGRMREGALPSPANQARVIQDVLALAQRENFHVNLIEAYDAPWKRALEGTVGGHWGLIDDCAATSNSPGARRCRTIRTGAGRRWAGSLSRRWCSRAALRRPTQGAGAVAFVAGASTANAVAGGCADRLDDRECAAGKPRRCRLVALAGAHRRRARDAPVAERRPDARRAAAAALAHARAGERAAHATRLRSRPAFLPSRPLLLAIHVRARAGVRPALQGFPVRADDGRSGAVPDP